MVLLSLAAFSMSLVATRATQVQLFIKLKAHTELSALSSCCYIAVCRLKGPLQSTLLKRKTVCEYQKGCMKMIKH